MALFFLVRQQGFLIRPRQCFIFNKIWPKKKLIIQKMLYDTYICILTRKYVHSKCAFDQFCFCELTNHTTYINYSMLIICNELNLKNIIKEFELAPYILHQTLLIPPIITPQKTNAHFINNIPMRVVFFFFLSIAI